MLLPLANLEAQRQRVQEVADRLSIPLTLVDLRHPFTERVVDTFIAQYRQGLTPNPCIHCNHTIKFDLLAHAMLHAGMERIATGHYARVLAHDNRCWIARAADLRKDQSYFLARLSAEQMRLVSFPLGDLTKVQVYERASSFGFRFGGEESQDVCFLADTLPAFLTQQGVLDLIGPVVRRDGRQIGEHRGVWHYTIGQRRGLGLPDATPWYVVELDGPNNRVVVGKHEELFTHDCRLHSLRWTHEPPPLPWRGVVQLRSRHHPALAELHQTGSDAWGLIFESRQRAITPGQFAVFYEDDRVVGSAIIGIPESECR
jgi:tRNA-uridine 2-sulfurtransferase